MSFVASRRWLASLSVLMLLSGCVSRPVSTLPVGKDGLVCAGPVMAPPDGLVPLSDAVLLDEASGASGEGKLCAGQVFVVAQPVRVYRVWDSARPYTQLGRWWSFAAPQGSRAQYREANAICSSWSALDIAGSCLLKTGSRIVVGPGQSARCPEGELPRAAVNQVYVPNDARAGTILVTDCDAGTAWPAPAAP